MSSPSFELRHPELVHLHQLQRRVEALEAARSRHGQDLILLANATAKLAEDRSKFFADLMLNDNPEDELRHALECFVSELEVWCATWTPTSYTDPRISLLRITERARCALTRENRPEAHQ